MAKSKNTTLKTEAKPKADPVESIAVPQQHTKRRQAVRRIPVQYTPRVPSARCPGC